MVIGAGALLGASLLGGGLAGLGSYFGGKPKKQDFDYQGEKPLGSQTGRPIGKLLNDILMQRMQGSGLGIDQKYLDRATSPYAQGRWADFNQKTRPELTASLAGSGMGDSSLGRNMMTREMGNVSRDIQQRMGEVNIGNEELKRRELTDALGRGQTFTSGEMDAQNRLADFEKGIWGVQKTGEANYNQAVSQNNMDALGRGITTGANIYGAGTLNDYLTKPATAAGTNPVTSDGYENYRRGALAGKRGGAAQKYPDLYAGWMDRSKK